MWKIEPYKYLSNVDNVSHFPLIINPKYGKKIELQKKKIDPFENDYLQDYISNIESTFAKKIILNKNVIKEDVFKRNNNYFKIRDYQSRRNRELYLRHELPRLEFEEKIGIDAVMRYFPKVKDTSVYYEIILPEEIKSRRYDWEKRLDFIQNSSNEAELDISRIIELIKSNYDLIQSNEIDEYQLMAENKKIISAIFWGIGENKPEIIYANSNEPSKLDSIMHNKSAIENQKAFRESSFISLNTLKKLNQIANKNHPFESTCELKYIENFVINQKSWKLFKKVLGYRYPKSNKRICGKILYENIGSPVQVEGVEAMKVTRSGETYNVEDIYTLYDVNFHTHVFPLKNNQLIPMTLSDADKAKTSSIFGGGLLLNYPYSLDYLIAWSRHGYGKNTIICDEEGNVIV